MINSGTRNLTIKTAQRIADAVEGVSVLDLGASEEEADATGLLLVDRLLALAATVEQVQEANDALRKRVDRLERDVRALRRERKAA